MLKVVRARQDRIETIHPPRSDAFKIDIEFRAIDQKDIFSGKSRQPYPDRHGAADNMIGRNEMTKVGQSVCAKK